MAESKELKSLLKVKEESEKAGLKLNIQKMKIMTSGPITSWHIDGEIMGTVTDFIFGGSEITADGDCSHEIKRCLLLGEASEALRIGSDVAGDLCRGLQAVGRQAHCLLVGVGVAGRGFPLLGGGVCVSSQKSPGKGKRESI